MGPEQLDPGANVNIIRALVCKKAMSSACTRRALSTTRSDLDRIDSGLFKVFQVAVRLSWVRRFLPIKEDREASRSIAWIFGYAISQSIQMASEPPCCPIFCAVPIVRRGEYDLTVNLVSTSGNTHAYTHTTTRAHPPVIHFVRRKANNTVSSQSPTTTPGIPKIYIANHFRHLLCPLTPALVLLVPRLLRWS